MQEVMLRFCLLVEKLTGFFYFSGLGFSLSSGSNCVTSSVSSSEALLRWYGKELDYY